MYIGADLVPTDINKTLFENGNGEAFVGKAVSYTHLRAHET